MPRPAWLRGSGWRWPLSGDSSLLAGAALALAAAMADPAITLPRLRPAMVVTLDITQSMGVADAPDPDDPATSRPRLAQAKRSLHQALAQLPCGSQVGWAVFTEYRSYLLLAPLEVCEHLAELRGTLAAVSNRMAWTGNSEVAKGLHSAWTISEKLPGRPALVFVTDGHEAPPIHPRFRPHFDDKPGEVAGLVVGVGGAKPRPIPKTDPQGRPLGEWGADDVLQTDPRSRGRGGSVSGETLSDSEAAAGKNIALVGATPGSEHLSALREAYLQRLATEQALGYHRLGTVDGLVAALQSNSLLRAVPARWSLAPGLLLLALALLLARYRRVLWRAAPQRLPLLRAGAGATAPNALSGRPKPAAAGRPGSVRTPPPRS